MTLTRQRILNYLDKKIGINNYQLYTPGDGDFNESFWNSCEWGQIGAPMNKISPPPISWKELSENA
jgi:hypothetical protein